VPIKVAGYVNQPFFSLDYGFYFFGFFISEGEFIYLTCKTVFCKRRIGEG
jgi:hypothetical protein